MGWMSNDAIVEFRSDEDRGAVLRLAYHAQDSGFGMFGVEIRAGGLSCDESVLTLRGDGLDTFLGTLASDWRGWEGTRTWDTLEHGMSIEATHRGNRVELVFVVRRDYESDACRCASRCSSLPESPSRGSRAPAQNSSGDEARMIEPEPAVSSARPSSRAQREVRRAA